MAPQDFVAALKRHKRFLEGQLGGVRADLSGPGSALRTSISAGQF